MSNTLKDHPKETMSQDLLEFLMHDESRPNDREQYRLIKSWAMKVRIENEPKGKVRRFVVELFEE